MSSHRADLRRELAAGLRARDRARLRELRERIREAKQAKPARVRAVRALARAERKKAAGRLRDLRRALREASTAARDVGTYLSPGMRALERVNVEAARGEGARRVAAAERELAEERATRGIEKAWTKAHRAAGPRKAEARAESDEQVSGDIAPELRPVWERVKRAIRSGPRRSRLEAFLEWVHDNPSTVERLQNEALYADVAALEREERELSREVRRGARYRGSLEELAARAAVPF